MLPSEFINTILPTLVRNAVAVSHTAADGLPVGVSKIGGTPDLPPDFVWPEYTGETWDGERGTRPMSFMAQFNLAEVAPYDTGHLLPATGMLWFFYEMETMCWGYEPAHGGCCKVVYAETAEDLIPTPPPEHLPEQYIVPERALTFSNHPDLPDYGEAETYHDVEWQTKSPWEAYDEACIALGKPPAANFGMNTKLLGCPELIQNPMWEECELVTNGHSTGRGFPAMTEEERASLKERSREWMLLLQLGSFMDGGRELMFGDLGSIYFCIRREDLASRDFAKVWLVLQCG